MSFVTSVVTTLCGHHIINVDRSKAGAVAEDALRSIIISQQLLGTKEIVLVKHTGCGMLTFKEEDAKHIIEANLGWVDSLNLSLSTV